MASRGGPEGVASISLTLPESDLLGEGWTAVKAGWTSTLAASRW